jgi:putative transposase
MLRHAGARRWAFNHAVAVYRHQRVEYLSEQAAAAEACRPAVAVRQPGFQDVNSAYNQWKAGRVAELPRWWIATHSDPAPAWVYEISSMVSLWAFREANEALNRYFDSATGRQGGPATGFPQLATRKSSPTRFKVSGGRSGARPSGSRHIALPIIGRVRTHESTRKLLRRIANGTVVVKNATISQRAGRWYVAFNCEVLATAKVRPGPSRRQRAGGIIGVDVGVKVLAALSTGELVPNPRAANRYRARLTRAQRAAARCERGSRRQQDLYRRLARLKHDEANLRRARLHELTTRLVQSHDHVVLEDLAIKTMTVTGRGGVAHPGLRVQQKAGDSGRGVRGAAPPIHIQNRVVWGSALDSEPLVSLQQDLLGVRVATSKPHARRSAFSLPGVRSRDQSGPQRRDQPASARRGWRTPHWEPTLAVASTAGETKSARFGEKPAPGQTAGVRRAAHDRKVTASIC